MSESQPSNKENMNNESKEGEQSVKKRKVSQKKEKEDNDEYVLAMPEKAKSLHSKIANATLEILKQEPLLSEKDIILRLIAKDQSIKEYFMKTQDISYIKYVIRQLAEKKYILRARIFGENKRVYFLLPEQLDQFKDRIIKAPKRSSESRGES